MITLNNAEESIKYLMELKETNKDCASLDIAIEALNLYINENSNPKTNFDVFKPKTPSAMASLLSHANKCNYCLRRDCFIVGDCYEGIKEFFESKI